MYDYLNDQLRVPVPFEDLLRAQVVAAVAAFDKLLHDIIRIGMCETFGGTRTPTPKYHSESIPIKLHSDLIGATIPPKEVIFEAAIVAKLGHLSFQNPKKISEGLSLIWSEDDKWMRIGTVIGLNGHFASTRMKLIADRRNAIVHESDLDPIANTKTPITRQECEDITTFIEACGNAIVDLVT